MKEQSGVDPTGNDRGIRVGFGRTYQRRAAWTATEAERESGDGRSLAERDIATVEGLREVINGSSNAPRWHEIGIIVGAVVLLMCVVATLILASAINARANRIIEADLARDRQVAERSAEIDRYLVDIDARLTEHFNASADHAARVEAAIEARAMPTTTPTTARRTTPTTRARSTSPTTAVRPTTTAPRPPPTTVRPTPPTTVKPCSFALLDLCLIP